MGDTQQTSQLSRTIDKQQYVIHVSWSTAEPLFTQVDEWQDTQPIRNHKGSCSNNPSVAQHGYTKPTISRSSSSNSSCYY